MPGPWPSFGTLYHIELFFSDDTSNTYKSSGTNSPAKQVPPNIAKWFLFIAQAEWAALAGGISPIGFNLIHVFSLILNIYMSFFIS